MTSEEDLVIDMKDIAGYNDKFNINRKLPMPSGIAFDQAQISTKNQVFLVGGHDRGSFEAIDKIFFGHKEDVCCTAMTDISFNMHGQTVKLEIGKACSSNDRDFRTEVDQMS